MNQLKPTTFTMKTFQSLLFSLLLFATSCKKQDTTNAIQIDGLTDTVEVLRDEVGINHIYAKNQHDLFFAQGYYAAKDRLFQFEIWRRQATGTVAEILGKRELKRDIGTRLFKFRGDMKTEMQQYHPDGEEIITAYTNGVNAYIEEVLQNPELLPITFKALGIKPQKWTPEVVISRHQGLLGNITNELVIGRAVAQLGPEKVKEYYWFHPKEPKLELDPVIDPELLSDNILELYEAYRTPVKFEPEDILPDYRVEPSLSQNSELKMYPSESDKLWIGSNNWVTSPSLAENGHAYMANDPHRTVAVPSLRYWTHLSAPGWDVIGGGEPEIPGISIGHNQYGAWGLTVFRTDGEDLMVYELNPENLNQYKYKDTWEDMEVINETIPVKNSEDAQVELRYTRHGPVTYIDSLNHVAYAVRCAWMEPGSSPYLASLRMNQAKNWEEFRDACSYSNIPGENMIWADKEGNIGWQAVGIAPVRKNFSGLVPVPGDGRYEWDGYLPIKQKPNDYNPSNGFISTANQNVTPDDYTEWDAIGFMWSDPFRGDRLKEVLGSGEKLSMEDMKALQTDYLSIPARTLIPLLENQTFTDDLLIQAQQGLLDWDFVLDKNSVNAAIYVAWERELMNEYFEYFPDPEVQSVISRIQMSKLMQWILHPESKFGENAIDKRNRYLSGTFASAVKGLSEKFGSDMATWQYGQADYKHVQIIHPLGKVVNAELQSKLNTDKLPRGGNQYTPGVTGSNDNQTSGATFRIIVDVNDWNESVGTNSPGQSGDPDSPFYKNLFKDWANDTYFPVYYTRDKIESITVDKDQLVPKQ
ncbi:penicillin acylase family protein [Muricauda sp. CAU 1631]|uniref:Penicillin acylase family protein n=2 Tax=[Muricauda] lutisoli TaxID=2816035 RepID=A0ABS3ETI8_9FLAO|nr:penicillin acylase family protein [[Muricauda] lutisoli]